MAQPPESRHGLLGRITFNTLIVFQVGRWETTDCISPVSCSLYIIIHPDFRSYQFVFDFKPLKVACHALKQVTKAGKVGLHDVFAAERVSKSL